MSSASRFLRAIAHAFDVLFMAPPAAPSTSADLSAWRAIG